MRPALKFALCTFHFSLFTFLPSAYAQDKVTYSDHVLPIFRNECLKCHDPNEKKGDLDLSTFSGVMAGSSSGEIVVPGDPSASSIYLAVTHAQDPVMPPKKKISDGDIDTIKRWIEGGLLESSGSKAVAPKKPRLKLALDAAAVGQPQAAPVMPGELPIESVVHTPRPGAVTALDQSPFSPLLAIGGQKQVVLYDTASLRLIGVLPFEEGFPQVLRFSRGGQLLLAAGGLGAQRGWVVLYDVVSGQRVTRIGADSELDAVLAADISADQSLVALGNTSKLVRVHSTETGEPVYEVKKHTDWVQAVAFSPDGVLLATADRNGGLIVWEARTGELFYDLRGHTAAITALAWRPDSNVLASASEDTTVRLWNMFDGAQIKAWGAHGGGALDVRFASDGRIVTAGRDLYVRLWDGEGNGKAAFGPMSDLATRATFTHDGQRVIGADLSGRLVTWNAADGAAVAELTANPPPIANRIAAQQQQIAELKTQLEALAAEAPQREGVQQAIAAAEAQVAQLNAATVFTKLYAARQQLADRREVHEQRLALAAATDAALQAARSDASSAEKLLAEGPATVEARAAEIVSLKESLPPVQAKLAELEADLTIKRARLAAQQGSLDKVAADAKARQDALNQGAATADAKASQIESARAQLQSGAALVEQAVADLTTAAASLAEADKALEAKTAEAAAAKQVAETNAAVLAQAQTNAAPKAAELQAAQTEAQTKGEALTAARADQTAANESATKEDQNVTAIAQALQQAQSVAAAKAEELKKADEAAAAKPDDKALAEAAQKLRAEQQTLAEAATKLQASHTSLQQSLADLRKRHEALTVQVAQVEAEQTAASARLGQLQTEHAPLAEAVAKAQADHQAAADAAAKIESERAAAAEAAAKVRTDHDALAQSIQSMKADQAKLNESIPALEAEHTQLLAALPTLRVEHEGLVDLLAAASTAVERTRADNAPAESAAADLRQESESLTARLAAAEAEVVKLTADLDAAPQRLAATREQLPDLERQLVDAQIAAEESDQLVALAAAAEAQFAAEHAAAKPK